LQVAFLTNAEVTAHIASSSNQVWGWAWYGVHGVFMQVKELQQRHGTSMDQKVYNWLGEL